MRPLLRALAFVAAVLPGAASAFIFGAPQNLEPGAVERVFWEPGDVATDRAGTWIVSWSRSEAFSVDNGIHLARSTDAGRTWSGVTVVSAGAPLAADHRYPSAAGDAAGRWVIVWQVGDGGLGNNPDEDLHVARSVDGGVSWSVPAMVEADAGSDGNDDVHPALATDGAGTWALVWGVSPGIAIARSTDGGATWSTPVTFGGSFFDQPHVAALGGGRWVVTHTAGVVQPGGIIEATVVHRSVDDGVTWSAATDLGVGGGLFGAGGPDIAADGDDVAVVWDKSASFTEMSIARSADGGATWTPPVPLPFSGGLPRIAHDAAGTWAVTFGAPNAIGVGNPGFHVHFALSTDATETFTPPLPVNTTAAGVPVTYGGPIAGAADGWVAAFDDAHATHAFEPPAACAPAPLADCATSSVARGSLLKIRNITPDQGDSITWKWAKGAVSAGVFGMPMLLEHDYRLCGYAAGGVLFDALAPHGGAWRFSGVTKLGYSDPLGVPNGVEKISLKRAANGQGKIVVRASGAQAPTPALPVALPLTVQLQAAHGPCFAATFSAPGTKTNGPIVFSGKSD